MLNLGVEIDLDR